MPRSFALQCLIATLVGALTALAFAPFDLFVLAPLSWLLLWWLCEQSDSPRRAAILGFAWGTGLFTAGLCWLYVALNVYGGMAPPLAGIAILGFCAHLGLYTAFGCWLQLRLRTQRPVFDAAIAAAAYIFAEWLRGAVMTTFPWLALAYTQTPPSPLAGWAPLIGVYGMGMLMVFVMALLGQSLRGRLRWPVVALALVLAVGGGALLRMVSWTQPQGEPIKVALLQTNIAQDQKWQPQRIQDWLVLNAELVRKHATALVVLPETTLPMFDTQLPEGYLDHLGDTVRAAGGDVVLGIFTRDADGGIYNSAITRGSSPPQRYSKNHLVPFGEFAPPGFGWFFKIANIPMSNQTPGGANQALLALAGQKIAMNICYEDVFGEELLYALPEATLMLNISNLAWYGDSHAQPQHLQIARVRALETGRPMLRATNTGMTAVIAPDGSVSAVLPAFQQAALEIELRGYQGRTPYSVLGNWPVLGCMSTVLLCSMLYLRRRTARRPR